jgi:protein-L-isoaspartate(D-aspartate) O-methyltransferase
VVIVGALAVLGSAISCGVGIEQRSSQMPETANVEEQTVVEEQTIVEEQTVAEGQTVAEEERIDERDRFLRDRRFMVERHLGGRDVVDKRVLEVMGRIPRERFVPKQLEGMAYADRPLPIGSGQTISQPYIVALMTQLAKPTSDSIALDVGTGSGYQAAVLAELCKKVYSIEIVEELSQEAKTRLDNLGYKNVVTRIGDGYRGWPEHAPFDLIIVAAAPDHIPKPLVEQLAPGGRLVIPVGRMFAQDLIVVEKQADGKVRESTVAPVAFVPMTGEARTGEPPD